MVETDVIHFDESASDELIKAPQEVEARASAKEVGMSSRYRESAHRGKEPVEEEVVALIGLEYPLPHRVTDIEEEEWEKMRKYLIGLSGESDPEHRYEPDTHIDIRGTVLGSHRTYQRVVEQFWIPRDAEYLQGVLDIGLHYCLCSYFIRGALVEIELYSQMEWVWMAYLKLLGEVTALRVDRRVNSKHSIEIAAPSASDVDKLRQELEESKRKARKLNETLRERDHAIV